MPDRVRPMGDSLTLAVTSPPTNPARVALAGLARPARADRSRRSGQAAAQSPGVLAAIPYLRSEA
jgi:hypothetical protein